MESEMAESQKQRLVWLQMLWKQLDHQHKGALDWKGLQSGMRKIDHPLKNADELLKTIIAVVDANGDGKVQYEEFRAFFEAAEQQLFLLFKTIDRDNNGRLDKEELQAACRNAGLSIPQRRLNRFFDDMDRNRDGYISFDEWRDFLLFMPNTDSTATLQEVLSFYSDVVTINSEGDSVVSDEKSHSIGTALTSLIPLLFGSILSIASPTARNRTRTKTSSLPLSSSPSSKSDARSSSSKVTSDMQMQGHSQTSACTSGAYSAAESVLATMDLSGKPTEEKSVLMRYLPEPGYFVAGAVAGGVSRTCTAPLDRLKVYLLVETRTKADIRVAVASVKDVQPVTAVKHAGRPLFNAVHELYKSGGVRGFFAGNGLNVVKIMPETAIRFGAYEFAKKALAGFEGHGDPPHINPYSRFVAGGMAGMMAQFCVYPLDTVKFRLQSDYVANGARGNKLLGQVLTKMWADGGLRATYRGVTMGLIGMFPYSAIDMGTFEFCKRTYVAYNARRLAIHEEDAQPSAFATGLMGAFSGAFGASVVYPLNVMRTRLQTQGTRMHPARYTGIWDVTTKTFEKEGIRGFYKGLMPNLLKVCPALSMTWVVYEKGKVVMGLH